MPGFDHGFSDEIIFLFCTGHVLQHSNREVCYPKTFLRIGSYYKTTIDNLKIMNHLKLLTKYN